MIEKLEKLLAEARTADKRIMGVREWENLQTETMETFYILAPELLAVVRAAKEVDCDRGCYIVVSKALMDLQIKIKDLP